MKTNWSPVEYFRVLSLLKFPQYLVSAYDVARSPSGDATSLASAVRKSGENGSAVLLDSGNYESFWKADESWSRDRFHEVLKGSGAQIAFCFDNQRPPNDLDALVADVESSVAMDQSVAARTTVLPIVHGDADCLPHACKVVAERLRPALLAVPERCLGDGLISRTETVGRIRDALNSLTEYVALHLLGTGNPTSILVYVAAGADSFDGLEWCQTVVAHASGHLHHFQHGEFFFGRFAAGQLNDLNYATRVLVHNLAFYADWMTRIRSAVASLTLRQLLEQHVPQPFREKLLQRIALIPQ